MAGKGDSGIGRHKEPGMSQGHKIVTQKSKGGLCPDDLIFRDGRIWRADTALSTPEEADVFLCLGLEWIDPWKRDQMVQENQ